MTEASPQQGPVAELLLDPTVVAEPYAFYQELIANAPVWRVPGTDVVIVSSFAAVTEATNRVDDFSSNIRSLLYRSDAGIPDLFEFGTADNIDVLATADPPVHTLHRNTVFPELVARRMAELRPGIEALAEARIDRAFTHAPAEFMDDVANAIPIRVVSKLIGFEAEDPDELLAAAFDSTAMLAATASLDEMVSAMVRTAEIFSWIGDQLQHAVEHGGEGILGVLGPAVAAGELEAGEGMVIMHTLLSAGGESTTSLLGNATHALALMPELQARMRAEPPLLTPFIEEMLRLESPFRYHLRHAMRTTELCGVAIPEGATMLLFWGAANRDPTEYDRPDDIVLDRTTPKHHLGFGRGIHHCVGAPLARLEAQVILGRFLERTAHFSLDPNDPPVRVNSLMVRRFERLPLVVT